MFCTHFTTAAFTHYVVMKGNKALNGFESLSWYFDITPI